MAQDYEMIGEVSPALDAVAAERQGWQDQDVEPLIDERTDQDDYSFRDHRANRQQAGIGHLPGLPGMITSMAAHHETPTAAMDPTDGRADYAPVPNTIPSVEPR